MPEFYTWVILLINQYDEINEQQLSVFGSRGGQNSPLMHVPLSRIIQFKNLRSVIFVTCIIPYFLYEVILHYKRKKRKKKKNVIIAHPWIDPGPLVPKSDTLSKKEKKKKKLL